MLDVDRIRRDGGTQGRASLVQSVVEEYAELMRFGTVFPPIRAWFDGENYWLSDGFHRVAAAELGGIAKLASEVCIGDLQEARWDAYAANSRHGLRRSPADIASIIDRAFRHPKGLQLSNNQIARHLRIPESTLRRWRKNVSTSNGEDTLRTAVRAGKAYSIETSTIGKNATSRRNKQRSLEDFSSEFRNINQLSSPDARVLFAIFGSWIFGGGPATVCLERIEEAVRELRMPPHRLQSHSQMPQEEAEKSRDL